MKLFGFACVMLAPTVVAVWTVRHLHATGAAEGVVWLTVLLGLVLVLFVFAALEENRL